jgi:hypothetical protein
MQHNRSKGKIENVKWSPISADTHFAKFLFRNTIQWYALKRSHSKITQHAWITLTPIIDEGGNLYNPVTPVVLFLN